MKLSVLYNQLIAIGTSQPGIVVATSRKGVVLLQGGRETPSEVGKFPFQLKHSSVRSLSQVFSEVPIWHCMQVNRQACFSASEQIRHVLVRPQSANCFQVFAGNLLSLFKWNQARPTPHPLPKSGSWLTMEKFWNWYQGSLVSLWKMV